jgi:hypothetical protein
MTRGRAEGPQSVHESTATSTTCPYTGVSRGSHVGGAARACARDVRDNTGDIGRFILRAGFQKSKTPQNVN